MNTLETVTLGEVCSLVTDGKHGDCTDEDHSGFFFVSAKDIRNGRIVYDDARQITERDFLETHRRTDLHPGDVLVTNSGTIGRLAVAAEDERTYRTTFQKSVAILKPKPKEVTSRFLYYFLAANLNALTHAAAGAVQKNLLLGDLRRFLVRKPNLRVQDRLATVLWAYDDLIENNRRRIGLLEKAARLLYREWFVYFRFPGHEHTKIKRGLPTGWCATTFADACSCLEDGDWIESKDQGGSDYRLLQISNIGVNEFVETGNYRYVTEETFNKLNCRELLPGHILIARMPTPIGRAWLVTEMPWKMITAVDGAIAVTNPGVADAYFLTYFLNSPGNLAMCEQRAVGATRPRITRRDVASLPLALPPLRLQSLFRDVVEPINKQRHLLQRQNEKLAHARDLLLPRLMNGEIEV